jgi:hypothetical protein
LLIAFAGTLGTPRFLETAMKALREIRDLFGIGAEAEGKLGMQYQRAD